LNTTRIPIYDPKDHTGILRIVTIRLSKRMKQCMIIILHSVPVVPSLEEEEGMRYWEDEKKRLVDMLTNQPLPVPDNGLPYIPEDAAESEKPTITNQEERPTIKVTSVYFQEYTGLSNPDPNEPVQHYYGQTTFEEKLGSCIFNVSPGAFFQVNTKGADVLYDLVVKYCQEITTSKKKKVILLDICCGTGTIGLTCLSKNVVDYVIGVDISEPAIKDANINANKNGYVIAKDDNDYDENNTKVKFIASKAESILSKEISKIFSLYDEDEVSIIAVVDPAREGLHPTVIQTLRNTSCIQRIIYVSCNPTGSLTNDVPLLCCVPTNKYCGQPFKPVLAQPVDMFPFTKHCELVMVLDRMGKDEFDVENYQKLD